MVVSSSTSAAPSRLTCAHNHNRGEYNHFRDDYSHIRDKYNHVRDDYNLIKDDYNHIRGDYNHIRGDYKGLVREPKILLLTVSLKGLCFKMDIFLSTKSYISRYFLYAR
jgi:hypothetical protein